jgi:hypothetical protein
MTVIRISSLLLCASGEQGGIQARANKTSDRVSFLLNSRLLFHVDKVPQKQLTTERKQQLRWRQRKIGKLKLPFP